MGLADIRLNVNGTLRPTDPIALFQSLTLRGGVENIWEPQAEALKSWTKLTDKNDVVIRMNTGGGKTLVGLLIAQAITNQTTGQVLYVCANNQLIEQTIDKARECGIEIASRYEGNWQNKERYDAGEVFCITNYASLFNGLSIFRNEILSGIIFDDAHMAENLIRDQFTLTIKDSEIYQNLINLFKDYFDRSSQKEDFEELVAGDWRRIAFVPTFFAWEKSREIREILTDSDVADKESTKFAWEHLRAHLRYCCVFVSSSSVQFSPSVIPLHALSYFQSSVQRLYLTATMPSQASFIRAFGVVDPKIISPGGKSGDAQRLFVFLQGDDSEQKNQAIDLVSQHKSCVISPSLKRLYEWQPKVNIFTSESGYEEIVRFKKSEEPEMLGLAARYDGVDLPGDSCRTLILDRLPLGENHFNNFIDQSVQVGTLRSSHTATRITQAIGRIFRSNTDHGVVFLRGNDLQAWVRNRLNRKFLPSLLQKQITLGTELAKKVQKDEIKYAELVDKILNGTKEWDDFYTNYINTIPAQDAGASLAWYEDALIREKHAYHKLWDGQYETAARLFSELARDIETEDYNLQAWYCHWSGLSYLARNDNGTAMKYYWKASTIRANLGRPTQSIVIEASSSVPRFQARRISSAGFDKIAYERKIRSISQNLTYGPNTSAAEEALRQLGELLGLEATRPDNESDSGPDVLWIGEGDTAVSSFELKTNKDKDADYSKDDIKDCNDHHNWIQINYPDKHAIEFIVGRLLPVSDLANPFDSLRIVEIEALTDLLQRLRLAVSDFRVGGNLQQQIQNYFNTLGLLWPRCIDGLKHKLAIDLKDS